MVERYHEWQRSGVNEPPPALPWAYTMASWCVDPVATAQTGRTQFRHPYPQNGRSWRVQQQWNQFPLRAMQHMVEAERVYSKPPDKWKDADRKFDQKTLQGCVELDRYLLKRRGL